MSLTSIIGGQGCGPLKLVKNGSWAECFPRRCIDVVQASLRDIVAHQRRNTTHRREDMTHVLTDQVKVIVRDCGRRAPHRPAE